MRNCGECRRLEVLLQESGLDYVAAVNRYNIWRQVGLDNSWASKVLHTAKATHDARRRELDEHAEQHAQPARSVAAST